MEITSDKNLRIQQLIRLREKVRERRSEKLFVIEGIREIKLACKGGYSVKEIFFCTTFIPQKELDELKRLSGKTNWIEITKGVYEKIALRESTEGVIAVGEMSDLSLSKIKLKENPLVLVVENVEKPGNLGALLRTADAAKLDAVIVCDPNVDVYNPNVIRSSLGCLFTNQLAVCTSAEAIEWLKTRHIAIYSATPEVAVSYFNADFKKPCAIVVGSEAEGLSRTWLNEADSKVAIPMKGEIDSLNVSVSAAVIVFEAVRQRTRQ